MSDAHDEILTYDDVAKWLKMPKSAIYEMTRERTQRRHSLPLPVTRICGHIRFRRGDIILWLDRCAKASQQRND